jgi:hypothetical protein
MAERKQDWSPRPPPPITESAARRSHRNRRKQELWNPEMTRFTLFFEPGRIKQGLVSRQELGPSLTSGRTYTLVIDPDSTYTGSVTVALSNVVDVTASITPGGAAVPVTFTTPGQSARLTFSGAAGQRVSLRATDVTGLSTTWLSILKPDGTTLTGPVAVSAGGTVFLDAVSLPTTGTYTVFVDPRVVPGGLTLTLYDVVDLTGAITIGGAAVPDDDRPRPERPADLLGHGRAAHQPVPERRDDHEQHGVHPESGQHDAGFRGRVSADGLRRYEDPGATGPTRSSSTRQAPTPAA